MRLVLEDVQNIRVRSCKGTKAGLTECYRPIFTFGLPKTFDIFFNGPWGYRAQYWISPETGLAGNGLLLAGLTPLLLSAVDLSKTPDLSKIDLSLSLKAASAKAWVCEATFPMENLTVDLDIARWVIEAENQNKKAKYALCAPPHAEAEVKGAFIDQFGNEVVPKDKIRRHFEIHECGWS